MKKLLTLVVVALLLSSKVSADDLTSASCPGSGCQQAITENMGAVGVQISNTFVGTAQFEQTIDNVNWVAWTVSPSGGGSDVTSTTGTGVWFGSAGGTRKVRVRMSAYTSGTATVSVFAAMVSFRPRSLGANPIVTSLTINSSTLIGGSSADIIEQRDGTNPQTFNQYRTFTDAANYSRTRFASPSSYAGNNNATVILNEAAGTGTPGYIFISSQSGGGGRVYLGQTSSEVSFFDGQGFNCSASATCNIGSSGALGNITQAGKVIKYNNITTAGLGLQAVYGENISTTQTANFTALTYTPPATAGRYEVAAVLTTTSATNTGTVQVTVDYTDSQGTVHTADILPLCSAAGTCATTQTGASKEFHTQPYRLTINNAAANIVLKVVITGSVSYTISPIVKQEA